MLLLRTGFVASTGRLLPVHRPDQGVREAGWSGHRWTTYDNPYMAEQWAGEIAELKAARPLVVETPWFRQMYLGEWVIDSDKLVYRFNSDRNTFVELPTFHAGEWHYVLGVDLGYNDPTAFALCAYHDYDKTLYVLEAEKHPRLDVTSVAERIRGYQARYELDSIIIDGANKQAVEEMRRRHELPLRAADKTGKSDFIEIMNGEFCRRSRRRAGPSTSRATWCPRSARRSRRSPRRLPPSSRRSIDAARPKITLVRNPAGDAQVIDQIGAHLRSSLCDPRSAAVPPAGRSDLNAARISAENSSGCSQAAK